jgi:two-component system cell cycle response regulator DivK
MVRPRRVLCVEDRPDHAELVGALLRGAGYKVEYCARGEEVLAQARRFAPDLVLMDINLPGLDGMAATRLLRGHPDTAHIPVLALTAYAMPGERQKILAAGCADIVTKPMDLPAFLATLDALLSQPPAPVPAR